MQIDIDKFWVGRAAFAEYVKSKDGNEFSDFSKSEYIHGDEFLYKRRAYFLGKDALKTRHWKHWLKVTPIEIITATLEACGKPISGNLLTHNYGAYSYGVLKDVNEQTQIDSLAEQLYLFFNPGKSSHPDYFSTRFDAFGAYLRDNHLSCRWEFLSYLSFLLNDRYYIPVRSTFFERVMRFHGVNQPIRGNVTWERYKLMLDFANALNENLTDYKPLGLVDIHSYIFVLATLLGTNEQLEPKSTLDWDQILAKRKKRAGDQEELGLLGERYIYDFEIARLTTAGRLDLANRVQWVGDKQLGYDISSFNTAGDELHIEVKSTSRSDGIVGNFWLTKNELSVAQHEGPGWTIYRVIVDGDDKRVEPLGNVVTNQEWMITPDSWWVHKR